MDQQKVPKGFPGCSPTRSHLFFWVTKANSVQSAFRKKQLYYSEGQQFSHGRYNVCCGRRTWHCNFCVRPCNIRLGDVRKISGYLREISGICLEISVIFPGYFQDISRTNIVFAHMHTRIFVYLFWMCNRSSSAMLRFASCHQRLPLLHAWLPASWHLVTVPPHTCLQKYLSLLQWDVQLDIYLHVQLGVQN